MNLYFRFIFLLLSSCFKPRIGDLLSPVCLHFRVLPNDLDLNLHMNNGRYLSIMDLGRFDLIQRSGLLKRMTKERAIPVLSAAQVRYRMQLKLWEPYKLESRLICWDEKWVYVEQRFIKRKGRRAGQVAAIAIFKGAFANRDGKGTVPTEELLKKVGMNEKSPEFPDYVQEWIAAENHFREHTRQETMNYK